MSILSPIAAALMAATAVSAFTTPTTHQYLPLSRQSPNISPQSQSIKPKASIVSTSCLLAYSKERGNNQYDQKKTSARSTGGNNRRRRDDDDGMNAFGDFEDDYGGNDDMTDDSYINQQQSQRSQSNINSNTGTATTSPSVPSSTFYSQKSLTNPAFSQNEQFFQQLCQAAKITRPSRIQSLAWPPLLRGENTIVADQTGSGKTLAYLLPLLQKLHQSDQSDTSVTQNKKKRTGSPRIVILTPTAELADQIARVCTSLSKNLASLGKWTFNPFVTTATGSANTNIRDQIRMLQSTPVDVLISTPGRLSTILRTKNTGLDLGHVQSLVLDEVDFLLADETFGPQLRTVGVAVQGGQNDEDEEQATTDTQFIFVTATLPEDVLESIQSEFPNVTPLRGPGLHRITPSTHQTLIDVSVPSDFYNDHKACFDIKVRELTKALRLRRCAKTLVFCNTVESCRNVENVLRRKDRGAKRSRVWAYHGALSHEARVRNLRDFSSGGNGGDDDDDGAERILVCTDRAARGIDFDANPIDHVLLFDFPKDPAEYVRRVGRTARAGRAGASTVLAYGWQLPVARQIMGLGGGDGKGSKKGVLESFTMMKSSDGWEGEEEEEYYVKRGARKRKDGSSGGGRKFEKEKPSRRSNETRSREWYKEGGKNKKY